jgi:multiple sugar transport system substrate-binding protein
MWNTCKIIKEEIMDKGLEPTLEFPMGYDSDSNLFITMCEQQGIPYTTNEGVSKPADHIQFNNADAKAMISDLATKYKAGWFATKNTLPNNSYTSTYFTEGKTVMSIGSTGGTSYNVSVNFDVEIAPAPVTANVAPKNKYILQGPSICFFKKGTDKVKEAAWNFYKYIVRAVNTAAYGVKSGYEPVRKSAYELDGYQEYLNGDSLQAKVSKVTATIGDQFFLSPVFYGSAAARDEVGNIFANFALGQKDLDQAFADAASVAIRACGGQ